MRRFALSHLLFLAPVCVVIFYWSYRTNFKPLTDEGVPTESHSGMTHLAVDSFLRRVPVPPNRGPEVLDGFRGDVHPLLQRHNKMEVTARWECQDEGKAFASSDGQVRGLFQNLEVAIPTKTYTEQDFSRFLPAGEFHRVGQLWALDVDKMAFFLKQFHPAPSMRLLSKGRRAGPDGAFAVLRAISPSHLDIVFRIHAEFDVLPKLWNGKFPAEAWYTPACFLGRLVLNRRAGTVDYFWLGVPTEKDINIHLTAADENGNEGHDVIHVERMELMGGNPHVVDGVHWQDQIETAQAHSRLAKVFYKFKEIDWIAFDQVQAAARVQQKPIFAMVLLGALDDQTC